MKAFLGYSFSLALFVMLPAVPVEAQDSDAIYRDRTRYDFILSEIYNYDLDAAESSLVELMGESPHDPKPYFFMTLVRWWRFVGDTYSDSFRVAFLAAADSSVKVCESRLVESENDTEARFFLGGTYGYLARYYVSLNSLFSAYKYGTRAKDIFSELIGTNDTLYDAYLAIGTYNCYAERIPAPLRIIASLIGAGGDSELGIGQLRLAADSGSYARIEALSMLGYVELELQNNYARAANIFSRLSIRYPSNPVFRLLLSNSYRKSARYEEAIRVCTSCLRGSSVKYVSPNQLAGIHAELAYCFMLFRDYKSAVREYELCCEIATGIFLKESPWIYYNTGFCEEKVHDSPAAQAYYRKVLDCEDYFDYHSLARKSIERIRNRNASVSQEAGVHPYR